MRHGMLGLTCLCAAAVVLAGCAKSNNTNATENVETTPAAAPAPAPAATISFADVAGKWNVRSVPESGDTTPTTYVMTTTADSTGWKIEFPKGPTVTAHPSVSGDSILMWAGPFSSVRRKNMQVTTNTVLRRQGDKLVGTTVAHYKTTKPDSVLRLNTEGTRAQ